MPESTGRALTSAAVKAAAEAGHRDLAVPAHERVTPLARDTARELEVRLVPASPPQGQSPPGPKAPPGSSPPLEDRVREIVARLVGPANDRHPPATGAVRHVDGRSVTLDPFPFPGPEPGQDVRVADVVTSEDGSPVAAGFMTLTRGCFPWTLTYDEIEYVIEGELDIGTASGTVRGRPGDVLYVPKGTEITFGTPSWAKFLYVTFPADWAEGST
jgi:ethanolamine utilization protein EutQ